MSFVKYGQNLEVNSAQHITRLIITAARCLLSFAAAIAAISEQGNGSVS